MHNLAQQEWGNETLSIEAGADELCAIEWRSLIILSPPYHVTREELIGAYHLALASVQIKYNLI